MTPLIPPDEAAELLSISVRTLKSHVDAGELRYVSLGRGLRRERRMFALADLEAFVEQRKRLCQSSAEKAPRTGTRHSRSTGADIFYLPERQTSERR